MFASSNKDLRGVKPQDLHLTNRGVRFGAERDSAEKKHAGRESPSPPPHCVVDMPDFSELMTSPVKIGVGNVQCDLVRLWGGFGTGPWLTEQLGFNLYVAGTNELMMSAKKRGTEYLISTYADNPHDKNHFAVLHCNFMRTEYCLRRAAPGSEKDGGKDKTLSQGEELACAVYDKNLKGDCPRKLTFVSPSLDTTGASKVAFLPGRSGARSMLEQFQSGDWQDLTPHATKPPVWNERLHRFEGGFSERVKHASIRNYLLEPAGNPGKAALQFGKSGKHRYSLDFSAPWSPAEAFACAITSFEAWGVLT